MSKGSSYHRKGHPCVRSLLSVENIKLYSR